MEITKNSGKIIAIVALLVAIAGLTIGYAALSTSLNIQSAAGTVQASNWSVKFSSLGSSDLTTLGISDPFVSVNTGSKVGNPSISNTTVSNVSLRVAAPGDASYYYWKIVNNGTYNAISDGITIQENGDLTSEEQTWLADNATFKIEYKVGAGSWTEFTNSTVLSLAINATIYVRASLTFSGAASTVPSEDITFPTKTITIPFVVAS